MNILSNRVEFSRIKEVFSSEIEQNELNRIFSHCEALLDLIYFCNIEFKYLKSQLNLSSTDDTIRFKLELYLALLEEINKLYKVDISELPLLNSSIYRRCFPLVKVY
jgi:hypothetical protein